jgi:TatD DNase family protein
MTVSLIDSHAHLIDGRFKHDLHQVLDRAKEAGLKAIINVGYDLSTSKKAVTMSLSHDILYTAVGAHPHDAANLPADYLETLQQLAKKPKVLAIGETGLDYYRNLSPKAAQQKVFREHLQLATLLSLPVIIHDRDAHEDVMKILGEQAKGTLRGVMHCFSGDVDLARRCLDLGFYISIAGPVTFKQQGMLAEVARFVPLDRLLVETDCPYLTPQPFRGKRNEPSYVYYVVEQVATLRGIDVESVASVITGNAEVLFGID